MLILLVFIMSNAVQTRITVEKMCLLREAGLKKFEEALEFQKKAKELMQEANEMFMEASGSDGRLYGPLDESIRQCEVPSNIKEDIQERVDARLWRAVFRMSPLWAVLDSEARMEMETSLEKAPKFNYEDAFSTVTSQLGQVQKYFRRGLVNAFRKTLDFNHRNYKSHDPFKLKKKIVLKIFTVYKHSTYTSYHPCEVCLNAIRDINRAFHTLDEKIFTGLEINGYELSRLLKAGDNVFETEYFNIKMFKNGNAHLVFKRPDLVEKCNREIAAHYADNTLGSKAA